MGWICNWQEQRCVNIEENSREHYKATRSISALSTAFSITLTCNPYFYFHFIPIVITLVHASIVL